MDGESLNFGACASVKSVRYPISLAAQICLDQSTKPSPLIPPILLVGQGATNYAKKSNLVLINNKKLISKRAQYRYNKFKRKLGLDDTPRKCERMDTVGAVCVDGNGNVASACSSGGILMKNSGRVGQAATYASGVWADSAEKATKRSVAVSTTGTGEYIVKTLLAKELAVKIQSSHSPALSFNKCMREDFLESRFLVNIRCKIGGALVVYVDPSGEGEILWGHSSRTMGVAYMNASQTIKESTFSEMPKTKEGNSITLSAFQFRLQEKD